MPLVIKYVLDLGCQKCQKRKKKLHFVKNEQNSHNEQSFEAVKENVVQNKELIRTLFRLSCYN